MPWLLLWTITPQPIGAPGNEKQGLYVRVRSGGSE
jgi:hypothetical protein